MLGKGVGGRGGDYLLYCFYCYSSLSTSTRPPLPPPPLPTCPSACPFPLLPPAGQDIIVAGVGEAYTTYEGYKNEETGETKIGISYAKLCTSVKPGNIILIADGAISIEVVEILSTTELKGKVVNSFKLGQRKNCNLPGQSARRWLRITPHVAPMVTPFNPSSL